MGPSIETVAVVAPGDMGHAVGAVLRQGGLRVITALEGRSARTRALAQQAGIEPVADDVTLVREADVLLSILVPARAVELAERMAGALRATGAGLIYVDCNAIAPATAEAVAELVTGAGARSVDAGIIGPPPVPTPSSTRFYTSGPAAGELTRLADAGLDIRPIGERVGDASALKMCYAALTKGTTALMTQLAVAAERLGVGEPLDAELQLSQAAMLERMARMIPAMVPKAHRWVGEMEEIARTFEAVGLTPRTFEGAAETYTMVAGTAIGQIAPEDWRRRRASQAEVITALATRRGG